jgi:hypothetical protein
LNVDEKISDAYSAYLQEHENHFNRPTSMYKFLRLKATKKVSRIGKSWMIYTVNHEDHVGLLRSLLAEDCTGLTGLACFDEMRYVGSTENFGNQTFRQTHTVECVPVSSICRMCCVQMDCASICKFTSSHCVCGDLDHKAIK